MKTLKSDSLKRILISGSNNLYNHYPEVDALNVFPVPDGDTGINMSLTCTSGAQDLQSLDKSASIYQVAKAFSHGLLMGARGNSGAITSQIFRGFASVLENAKTIDGLLLAQAFRAGSESAYKAVNKPVEGTILTVIRESSHVLSKKVDSGTSIDKAFEILYKAAQSSLERTPELLPILKEVGVVDSGGAGLVRIIEGMYLASIGKFVNKAEDKTPKNAQKAAAAQMEGEEFGYCTEFIMSLGPDTVKKPFNQKITTDWLSAHGKSLVLVVDEDILKVHVHTLTPGEILNYAQQFGEFLKLKIENMTEQHHALENGANIEVTQDLVKKEPEKKYGLISVCSGNGLANMFNEIGVDNIVDGGQTMNPSSEDFVKAIKAANAKNVFILPNNSNIVMAASQACDLVAEEGINAFVIPCKTIPQGIVAALSFDSETTPENNFKAMKSSLKNVKSGEITYSIRDCEIKGIKIKKDDFIGVYEKDIICGTSDRNECLYTLVGQMVDDDSSLLTLILGDSVKREEILPIKKHINELYPDLNIDIKQGDQPVYSFLVGVE
ncbi:MAG: DAK2 domain-containing protein [Bacilli bacterium]|nr:DAK2 domain-containing protein [Bacilli bacterium]